MLRRLGWPAPADSEFADPPPGWRWRRLRRAWARRTTRGAAWWVSRRP